MPVTDAKLRASLSRSQSKGTPVTQKAQSKNVNPKVSPTKGIFAPKPARAIVGIT